MGEQRRRSTHSFQHHMEASVSFTPRPLYPGTYWIGGVDTFALPEWNSAGQQTMNRPTHFCGIVTEWILEDMPHGLQLVEWQTTRSHAPKASRYGV